MSKSSTEKLAALQETRQRLQREIDENIQLSDLLRDKVAGERADELFDLSEKFARLFTNGVVSKVYRELLKKADELQEIDSNWQHELASKEPYGKAELNPEQKYYVGHLFPALEAGSHLLNTIVRIGKSRMADGNPFQSFE